MSAFQSLAPRPPANLETVHNILGSLVGRYGQEEVLTAVRQIPARDAKFRPMPVWVTSALAEARTLLWSRPPHRARPFATTYQF